MNRRTVFGALVIAMATLSGCNALYRGVEGNVYEKMTVFSLIVFTVFAILFVPFVTDIGGNRELARFREVIWKAAVRPLSADELAAHPAFVRDSPHSFYKMVFDTDGSLRESGIVTINGHDPTTERAGSWTLTGEGTLQVTFDATRRTKSYACISEKCCDLARLMRLETGFAEAWYMGAQGLALAQISCFGYSRTVPPQGQFSDALIGGLTVYWATYPCIALTSADEVCVNPALVYGSITFHADGTLSKSRDNQPYAAPNYSPAFSGSWRIDPAYGVLDLSIGPYTREIKLLLKDDGCRILVVGTTEGNEQWFLDQERGGEELARYLAAGVYLDAEKWRLFAGRDASNKG